MFEPFGHNSIRKYVAAFGTLFNNIYLERKLEGLNVQSIKVPLSYAEKDRMLARVAGDPNLDNKVAITLPRMSFAMVNMNYDGSRKLPKRNRTARTDGKSLFNPTPYNFEFELYIAVKNSEDGTRILEQILPYFTPDWNLTVNLVPGVDSKVDTPIVLNNVSKEDNYEGNYTERRSIIWTLSFTLKGYLFGPVNDVKRIEEAIANIFNDTVKPPYLLTKITATEDGIDIEEF